MMEKVLSNGVEPSSQSVMSWTYVEVATFSGSGRPDSFAALANLSLPALFRLAGMVRRESDPDLAY